MHLGLFRGELGEDAGESKRILAEDGSHPVVTGGGGVSLVEHQVDDLEHRRQAVGEITSAWNFERDLPLREGALGADDSLRDSRLGNKERARDFFSGKAAEQAEGKGDARFGGKHRVAGDEDEPQQVVADVVVNRGVEIRHGRLLKRFQFMPELLVLSLEHLVSSELVDRPMLRRGHEPGARISWNSRLRPLFERGNESVLREILSDTDVAHEAGKSGDEPGRFDPPDGVDRAVCIGD